MAKQFTVATILNNHSKEIYAEVEKVKSKSDLPKVTNLIADILKKEDNSIRFSILWLGNLRIESGFFVRHTILTFLTNLPVLWGRYCCFYTFYNL